MFVLFETGGGFAIFKLLKENKLQKPENLYQEFQSARKVNKLLQFKHFEKFETMDDALKTTTATLKGKMSLKFKKFLKKLFVNKAQEELAVADAELSNAISTKLSISCVNNSAIQELMRCIRMHLDSLIEGILPKELAAMSLAVAHGLSRNKLKSSPERNDKMIIEAVSALDYLNKKLDSYVMRCKEWYGWHFPELSKIISDDQLYIKTVLTIGFRENAINTDLSDLLSEEDEQKVKEVAEISLGIDILEEHLTIIKNLCEEVLKMQECESKLYEYLKNKMSMIAPNVASLVGEINGARLIAHAGLLVNLAKHPASTVQILFAEKDLFSALKGKYGDAKLLDQSNTSLEKRILALKIALASRVDVFGEEDAIGLEHRARFERALKMLEERKTTRISETEKPRSDDSTMTPKNEFSKRKHDTPGGKSSKKLKIEVKEEDD